jgi:hypothetical protein
MHPNIWVQGGGDKDGSVHDRTIVLVDTVVTCLLMGVSI